ncbi:unnamed protein product [Schistosoma guineensis]|nr:unnamed protein product [Schistosoma guineensis]
MYFRYKVILTNLFNSNPEILLITNLSNHLQDFVVPPVFKPAGDSPYLCHLLSFSNEWLLHFEIFTDLRVRVNQPIRKRSLD